MSRGRGRRRRAVRCWAAGGGAWMSRWGMGTARRGAYCRWLSAALVAATERGPLLLLMLLLPSVVGVFFAARYSSGRWALRLFPCLLLLLRLRLRWWRRWSGGCRRPRCSSASGASRSHYLHVCFIRAILGDLSVAFVKSLPFPKSSHTENETYASSS